MENKDKYKNYMSDMDKIRAIVQLHDEILDLRREADSLDSRLKVVVDAIDVKEQQKNMWLSGCEKFLSQV